MRLEHNRVGDIARSDWENSKGRWVEYAKIFSEKQLPLLVEQNRLRNALRRIAYSDEVWNGLSDEERADYTNKQVEVKWAVKSEPTLVSSDLLDDLKRVKLYELSKLSVADPLEDFGTYTETDPGTDNLSVATNQITFTNLDRESGDYVLKDFGAAHFGNFEHLYKWCCTALGAGSYAVVWHVGNDATPDVYSNPAIFTYIWFRASANSYVYLGERTASYQEDSSNLGYEKFNVPYYLTTKKDATALTSKIYTDAARTVLYDTLSLAITDNTFRYMTPCCTFGGSGAFDINGYSADLDLQEAAGASIPIIMHHRRILGVS